VTEQPTELCEGVIVLGAIRCECQLPKGHTGGHRGGGFMVDKTFTIEWRDWPTFEFDEVWVLRGDSAWGLYTTSDKSSTGMTTKFIPGHHITLTYKVKP
jgi:hypothetical protein